MFDNKQISVNIAYIIILFAKYIDIDIRKLFEYALTMVLFPDDRRFLSYEPVVTKHCPNHHLRGGPPTDGRDCVRRFLEVSRFPSYRFLLYRESHDITTSMT